MSKTMLVAAFGTGAVVERLWESNQSRGLLSVMIG